MLATRVELRGVGVRGGMSAIPTCIAVRHDLLHTGLLHCHAPFILRLAYEEQRTSSGYPPPNCPPRWFHFAQTANGFTQFQNMACLLTVITMVLRWFCYETVKIYVKTSGLLNHSLPRCSKICCQDESATGAAKTILPPKKFSLPPHAPPI